MISHAPVRHSISSRDVTFVGPAEAFSILPQHTLISCIVYKNSCNFFIFRPIFTSFVLLESPGPKEFVDGFKFFVRPIQPDIFYKKEKSKKYDLYIFSAGSTEGTLRKLMLWCSGAK